MKLIEPPYTLLDRDNNEWRFQESSEMIVATQEFDRILERRSGSSGFGAALRKYLEKHPNHIDALHHYASYLHNDGKFLDSLAYSQLAVATGMDSWPNTFVVGRDRLPTSFVQNRPFLRALHGLMLAQRSMNLVDDAISTGEMCLALDREDRMGARESLVIYLLERGRNQTAVELFERPIYKETFFGSEYLHALALFRLGRQVDGSKVLEGCLYYYPQVARFILDRSLAQPENEDRFGGIISGSALQGWISAQYFGSLWRSNRSAMTSLRKAAKPYAEHGWTRFQTRTTSSV